MPTEPITITGQIHFKIRFNTAHCDTGLYWRIIIGDNEYLACTLHCKTETRSDASFDTPAGVVKYHIAGNCRDFRINEEGDAIFS